MKIIKDIKRIQQWSKARVMQKKSIGLVPTMGALHAGHMSLVRRSIAENDATVVSVFVNPAQFGPSEDYKKYPRTFRKDSALLKKEKVDLLFLPSAKDMYPEDFSSFVEESSLSRGLCGSARPGHFKGVATVVSKLFALIMPDKAYFGEKDYQQLKVIQRVTRDIGFSTKIVPCSILRESDGLALSSRNAYLAPGQRQKALEVYKSLQTTSEMIKLSIQIKKIYRIIHARWKHFAGCTLEYIKCVDPETLKEVHSNAAPVRIMIAARIGKTRLIDNILVKRS